MIKLKDIIVRYVTSTFQSILKRANVRFVNGLRFILNNLLTYLV